jgi:ABC-type uncharacterized transport system involved in gliding motility auxiliary subunit
MAKLTMNQGEHVSSNALIELEQELQQQTQQKPRKKQRSDYSKKRRAVRRRRILINLATITLLIIGIVIAGWSSSGLLAKW